MALYLSVPFFICPCNIRLYVCLMYNLFKYNIQYVLSNTCNIKYYTDIPKKLHKWMTLYVHIKKNIFFRLWQFIYNMYNICMQTCFFLYMDYTIHLIIVENWQRASGGWLKDTLLLFLSAYPSLSPLHIVPLLMHIFP